VSVLLATFEELGSVPVATLLGRGGRKLSLLDAPVANGQMGHVLDFDDTHLGGVILHTSTATLPALFALGDGVIFRSVIDVVTRAITQDIAPFACVLQAEEGRRSQLVTNQDLSSSWIKASRIAFTSFWGADRLGRLTLKAPIEVEILLTSDSLRRRSSSTSPRTRFGSSHSIS